MYIYLIYNAHHVYLPYLHRVLVLIIDLIKCQHLFQDGLLFFPLLYAIAHILKGIYSFKNKLKYFKS